MTAPFGFLSKLTKLQDLASILIARINPAIIHNVDKYTAIKKSFYLSALEDIKGSYFEFGVFTGSSFCHSIRCSKALESFNSNMRATKFYGFDSFEGFGALADDDQHPFFVNSNFKTSLNSVLKRVRKITSADKFQLIPGFFSDSLKNGPRSLGIEGPASIVFIDSDTHSSAQQALAFCQQLIQDGTIFILDDYFAYKGNPNKGVANAFTQFIDEHQLMARQVFSYGMGGAVFIISMPPNQLTTN